MGVRVRQKDGKWYVFINHQKQRKAVCVGDSRKTAELVKQRIEAQLVLGGASVMSQQPSVPTFAAYAQQWLEGYVTLRCKPSTQRVVEGVVRLHLVPTLGALRLDAIPRSQVRALLQGKAQQYARKYVRQMGTTLHTIFAQAVEEELLQKNPATRLGTFLPPATPMGEIDPFTSAELARYLTTMRAKYPQHYAYFLTLARTGMREGEALGLQWGDLQFVDRTIHIRRTWDVTHKRTSTPKTGASRTVAMSEELQATLRELHHARVDAAFLAGHTAVSGVVFRGPDGPPYNPSTLRHVHKRVCEAAGLRVTRIHDLRHSVATILLYEYHEAMQTVAAMLGHASIRITVDTYGHPTPGQQTALVDRLDTPIVCPSATPVQRLGPA